MRSLAVSTVFLGLVGAAWLAHTHYHYKNHAAAVRRTQTKDLREELVSRTEDAVDYAAYMREKVTTRLKRDIRNRIERLHAILKTVHEHSAPGQAESIIRDILRNTRFHDGKGYFFAIRVADGVGQVIADRPDLEGTDLRTLRDSDGVFFIQRTLAIARGPGRGFFEYRFTMPGAEGDHHRKIAYIKYFEPLDWYIGTGLYVEDVARQVQMDVLERLESVSYPDGGYLFAGTLEGQSLLGPAKGRNMYDVQDEHGVYIVRELIAAAKAGGGFVEYVLPSFDGGPSYPKFSYAMPVPEWGWYIGTGIGTQVMESRIDALRQDYLSMRRTILVAIGATLAVLLAASALIARSTDRRMRKDFEAFQEFFARAAQRAEPIDLDAIQMEEFDALARSANTMVEARAKALRALRESEARYRSIFDNITDGFFRAGPDGTLLLLSPSAKRMLGYAEDEDPTGQPLDLAPGTSDMDTHELMRTLFSGGSVDNLLATLKRRDGAELPVEINARLIRDDDGRPAAVEGMFRDVSERLKTQELLVQTEKMMSVGGLAAGMAHEINNPLGGVLQGVQNIRRRLDPNMPANRKVAEEIGCDTGQMHAYVERRGILRMLDGIRKSGERAAGIVAGMLSFARRSESHRAPCRLDELADHAVALAGSDYDLKKKYDFKDIEIVREYAPDLPDVPCTATEIEQVLLNLLRNAAHAMGGQDEQGESPRIILRTRREGDMAVIEVADNGPGMDEDTRKRVFEPFYTTKPPGRGTGLGLSVSYFIVTQNHKGTIEVASAPGRGATFTVTLPLAG